MACIQILLVNRWDLEQGFWCCFADLTNQGLIISTTRLKQWTLDDNKVILVLLLLSLPLKNEACSCRFNCKHTEVSGNGLSLYLLTCFSLFFAKASSILSSSSNTAI